MHLLPFILIFLFLAFLRGGGSGEEGATGERKDGGMEERCVLTGADMAERSFLGGTKLL